MRCDRGVVITKLIKERKVSSFMEVGVHDSTLTKFILRDKECFAKIKEYWGCDPFLVYSAMRGTQAQWDWRYLYCCRLGRWFPQHHIIRSTSETAASLFPDKYFDMVFIDADHKYESVRKDIGLWLPKVKSGGTLAGHDYTQKYHPGVERAVSEIFGDRAASIGATVWVYDAKEVDRSVAYDESFFCTHLRKHRGWERTIGIDICKRFGISSAVDFGCGVGSYLEGMLDFGLKNLRGFEFSYDISIKYTPSILWPYIQKADVTKPIAAEHFDLAMSFECAEHLQPEGTEQFLKNITSATDRLLILTAAPPGQKGTHHINCRPKSFWVDSVKSFGFEYLDAESQQCSVGWAGLKAAKWVCQNVMVFRRLQNKEVK